MLKNEIEKETFMIKAVKAKVQVEQKDLVKKIGNQNREYQMKIQREIDSSQKPKEGGHLECSVHHREFVNVFPKTLPEDWLIRIEWDRLDISRWKKEEMVEKVSCFHEKIDRNSENQDFVDALEKKKMATETTV